MDSLISHINRSLHEHHIEMQILWVFRDKLEWSNEWSLERNRFEVVEFYLLRTYLFMRDKRSLLSGATSLYFKVKRNYLFIFCGVNSAISISRVTRWRLSMWCILINFWPYSIPTGYLNPVSRDDFVANSESRRYLNPEFHDNFWANPVSRRQKRSYPASHQAPLGAPYILLFIKLPLTSCMKKMSGTLDAPDILLLNVLKILSANLSMDTKIALMPVFSHYYLT